MTPIVTSENAGRSVGTRRARGSRDDDGRDATLSSVAQEPQPGEALAGVLTAAGAIDWITIAASGVLVAFVMGLSVSPIGRHFDPDNFLPDFATHISLAEHLVATGINFPHFLWHILVIAVHTIASAWSWVEAAHAVVVASYGLQAACLAWILTKAVPGPPTALRVSGIVALVLLLVTAAPVTVLTWGERAFYFGYLNMDSYASPTQALLKPLALIVFVLTVRGLEGGGGFRRGILLATVAVLSALAKPSLLICLLPATIVLAAVRWPDRRKFHFGYLLAALLVPSVTVLAWQYLVHFGEEGRSSIMFAPLLVMGHNAIWLGPKFLLSILLPLTVLLAYWRESLSDSTMQLAWLQFAFAAGYTYLLAESFDVNAGNFVWSGQIATYLLFVASVVFVLRRWAPRWRSIACGIALGLHAVSGALFFAFPLDWGTRPVEIDRRNAALADTVKRTLAADAMVGHIPFEVEADGHVVRLESDQTNAEERARAVEVAADVSGVWRVENQMK